MYGLHSSILVAITLVASAPVFADDLKASGATPRELAHCMMKRLRANTAESYRDAFNACRAQADSARADRPLGKAMTAATLPENPKQ